MDGFFVFERMIFIAWTEEKRRGADEVGLGLVGLVVGVIWQHDVNI